MEPCGALRNASEPYPCGTLGNPAEHCGTLRNPGEPWGTRLRVPRTTYKGILEPGESSAAEGEFWGTRDLGNFRHTPTDSFAQNK